MVIWCAVGVGAAVDSTIPGLYVCGWLKRGPTGIIGTNLTDAEETVNSLAQDCTDLQQTPAPGRSGLLQILQQRRVPVVDYAAWEKLNQRELQRGASEGAARVKSVSIADMLVDADLQPSAMAGSSGLSWNTVK